jgi:hypothetical protein
MSFPEPKTQFNVKSRTAEREKGCITLNLGPRRAGVSAMPPPGLRVLVRFFRFQFEAEPVNPRFFRSGPTSGSRPRNRL